MSLDDCVYSRYPLCICLTRRLIEITSIFVAHLKPLPISTPGVPQLFLAVTKAVLDAMM